MATRQKTRTPNGRVEVQTHSLELDQNEITLMAEILANGAFPSPLAKHVAANLQIKLEPLLQSE